MSVPLPPTCPGSASHPPHLLRAAQLHRWNPDIYSGEVVASRKIRLESESRNQAVYELRKFVTKITEDVLKRKEAEEMAAEAQQEED